MHLLVSPRRSAAHGHHDSDPGIDIAISLSLTRTSAQATWWGLYRSSTQRNCVRFRHHLSRNYPRQTGSEALRPRCQSARDYRAPRRYHVALESWRAGRECYAFWRMVRRRGGSTIVLVLRDTRKSVNHIYFARKFNSFIALKILRSHTRERAAKNRFGLLGIRLGRSHSDRNNKQQYVRVNGGIQILGWWADNGMRSGN